MDDKFGGNIISISDEDGNDYQLEHIDTVEMDGSYYLAFLPADMDEDSEDYGIVVMKSVSEDGEDDYLIVPEDDETERAYNLLMERLYSEEEDEE